jgi:adenosine deaminase
LPAAGIEHHQETQVQLEGFVRALPKAELHLHLEGAVSATTAVELAKKHGLATEDFEDASRIFEFADLGEFLTAYDIICRSIVDRSDFHRVTLETLARCAENGARYVEFFFSPQSHLSNGVAYSTMLDGIVAAIRDATHDYGVQARLIPALNRESGADIGNQILDLVLSDRREEVIGIGLDYNEVGHPPGPYAGVFKRAKTAGLHVTAHAAENGPAANVADSLDLLGCDRIDHGYHVIDDPALLAACRERCVFFTVCPTTTTHTTRFRDLSSPEHAIRRMLDSGLNLVINTDDPALFHTNLATEYLLAARHFELSTRQLGDLALNSVRASWIEDLTKRAWLADWGAEIDRMLAPASATAPRHRT